jgi:16S rRNA (guanine966-N2)-methyltransferase
MGKVRIIGGEYRSRIIQFKDNMAGLRPTPDRVRETLFNWLGQDLTGKICLDTFAGSGVLGFEAVSRRANQVVMLEKNPAVVRDLRYNKELLVCSNIEVIQTDSLSYLQNCNKKFDVIFLDPPYNSGLLLPTLNIIKEKQLLLPNATIYVECAVRDEFIGFTVLKHKVAGAVNYALLKLANN